MRFQLFERDIGRRVVQDADAGGQIGQRQAGAQSLGQGVVEAPIVRYALDGAVDQAAQGRLAEARGGRIDRGQAFGQRLVDADNMKTRVDDLAAEEAAAHLAEHTQPRARLQHLLLRRIEIQKAQHEQPRGVAHFGDELAARAVGDLGRYHLDFELGGDAGQGIADRRQPRFVLVAQRQVEDQVGFAPDAEPAEFFGDGSADARQEDPLGRAGQNGRCFCLSQRPGWRRPRPARRAAVP